VTHEATVLAHEPATTAPEHLKPDTREWWHNVVNTYELDEHHLKLLTLAGEAWDRGQQAREILEREGLTYLDRFEQPKSRPEVAIERDSRIAFARMLRELALDVEPPAERKRPPHLGGRY
jgi:P27 family predicted phage terminase small subunit